MFIKLLFMLFNFMIVVNSPSTIKGHQLTIKIVMPKMLLPTVLIK